MTALTRQEANRISVSGSMTLDGAAALLAEGAGGIAESRVEFDLSGVTDVDSSGLAVIFGWQRVAARSGKSLRIHHPPRSLLNLAEMYGVEELIEFV